MIVFSSAGRFGNQIFQFLFLETIRKKKETVFSINLGLIPQFFSKKKYYHNIEITNFFMRKFYYKFCYRNDRIIFFYLLSKIRLISLIREENRTILHRKGILPITYVYGYFQSELFFKPEIAVKLQLAPCFIKPAELFFMQHAKKKNCFIHVRHGDYPLPSQLAFSFYLRALDILKNNGCNIEETHFFIVGDDPLWCEDKFAFLPHKVISHVNHTTDFALMTLCDGGIISNSSFAWLGAYLCKKNVPIIAPKYWMGIYKKEWEPLSIQDTFFVQFIDAE